MQPEVVILSIHESSRWKRTLAMAVSGLLALLVLAGLAMIVTSFVVGFRSPSGQGLLMWASVALLTGAVGLASVIVLARRGEAHPSHD